MRLPLAISVALSDPSCVHCSAYYVVGIPFGLWLAFTRHYNLYGLWIGLTIALVYEASAGVLICLRTNWDYQVEKVRRRLEAEHKAGVQNDTERAAQEPQN